MDWPWTNMGDYHRANPIYRILDGLVGQCPKRITNRVQGPFSDTSWRNSCVLEKEFRSPTTFSHSKLDGFPILTIDMLFYNWFCVFFLRIQTSAIFLGHFLWFSSTKFLNCEPYVVVFWTLRDSHPDSSALHPLHPIIHNKQAPNRQEKTHIYQLIGGIPTPWKKWKSDWIIIPTTGENKKVPVTTNQKTYLPLFWTPRTTNFMEFLHLSVFLFFFFLVPFPFGHGTCPTPPCKTKRCPDSTRCSCDGQLVPDLVKSGVSFGDTQPRNFCIFLVKLL